VNTNMNPYEALNLFEQTAEHRPAFACAKAARKTRQLCKEVSRTLSCTLGASRDPLIRDLTVVSVEPAPDAARLLVTVCSMSETPIDSADLLLRLREARGRLRAEIAAVLQRRRTPEVIFRLVCGAPDVQ
jgi:ribosome-binding factor A